MKTSTKILIVFLAIIILGMVQMGVTYTMLGDILGNTRQIKDIEDPLVLMMQQGSGYGSIASDQLHSAILHAQKGEYGDIKGHKMAYDAVEMKLNDIFNRDARILLNQSIRPQEAKDSMDAKLKETERLNILMVDLGTRAFTAMDKKDAETAYSLVMGGDYEKYQKEVQLAAGDLSDIANGGVLDVENSIVQQTQQVIYFNLIIAIILILLTLMDLLIIYSFFLGKEKMVFKKEKELDVRDKMEQKYRVLFENANEAIFIADSKTRQLVDCNKSAEELTGYSRAKILSMRADDLHPKDKLKKTMEGFRKQAEGKIKFILTEVLTKNKKRIPVKINASAVKIGSRTYSQGIFMKIK